MSRNRDHIDKVYQYGLDLGTRTLWLNDLSEGEDESTRLQKFLMDLHVLDSMAPSGDKPINIVMNHSGGDIYSGMAAYDAIKQANNHVTILVRCMAASMGAIILQAADRRILSKHAVVMIHHGSTGYEGHKKDVKAWYEFDKKYADQLDQILLNRIKEKKKSFSMKQLDSLQDFDTIFTADKAVAFGLADEVESDE